MSKEENSEAGNQEAAASDAPPKDPNADIYENRGPKKIIRVVTVLAYLFSVSFVGILLSTYYIFLWEPPNPRLIEREHLREDPQMQLLIAAATPADLNKEDRDFLVESKVNRTYKPLLGRIAPDAYKNDVDPQHEINLAEQGRLRLMLLKLRQSLVEAQKRKILPQIATISGGSDNSFIKMESPISEYNESRRNIPGEKTRSDSIDLPSEFTNSASMLEVESTSLAGSAILLETETKRSYSDEVSVDPTSITERGKETRNYQRKHDGSERYPVRRFSKARRNNDVTSGSNRRVFEEVWSKVIRESPKLNISNDTKEPMRNETNDRQSLNNDRKNNPSDLHMIVSEEYIKDHTSLLPPTNASVDNRQENYSGKNDETFSSDQTERIARGKVSIDTSSRDSGFTGDLEFHQSPDNPTVVKSRPYTTRNSEETQIERMTTKSTTIDIKQFEETEDFSTQQQKVFWTEAEDEETSAELTSISTTRNYRNNFTSAVNDDDESVT